MMIFALLAAVAAGPLPPLPTVAPREASIRDAASGGIRDWHSDDGRSIFLRDRTGRWYHATFAGPCAGVLYSSTIGFKTDVLGAFDRFSTISTERGLCSVSSVVRSAKPAAIGRR